MPRLVIRPLPLEKILIKNYGFYLDHQTGSHRILLNQNGRMVVIPLHDRELKEGTLHSILKQAGLTKDDIRKFK
jgi:predicted RNA binding protein YcfA (HicA-like mRNA interferase family)